MHKAFVTIVFSMLCLGKLSAQQNTNTNVIIGIQKFTSEKKDYDESAAELRAEVNDLLSSKKHIILLDRAQADAVLKELDVQKNVEYLKGITVDQNKAVGAKMLLAGEINSISITENKLVGGLIGGGNNLSIKTCKLKFSLSVIDVETGLSIGSKAFSVESKADFSGDIKGFEQNKDAMKNAVTKAKANIDKEVNAWIDGLFPPNITLASVDTRRGNGKPKTVSITMDAAIAFSKGTLIAVNEITTMEIGGVKKTKKVQVATLKVIENQGDFISCEVKDGEDVLEDKWKNSRIQLVPKG